MTPNQFRKLALAMPGVTEGAHGGHPDFRVGGKVLASLGHPDATWGVVLLKPDQQAMLIETTPKAFSPVPGGWGLRGATRVNLAVADQATVRTALKLAWEIRAPKPKPDARGVERALARALKAAKTTTLPGIEEGTSYGTPSLSVAGKFLMRVKDADTLVFRCTPEEKAFLMEADPSIYFETTHYVGWPVVLVRLAAANDAELKYCVERAWRLQAPKKLKAERETRPAPKQKTSKGKSPARKASRRKSA